MQTEKVKELMACFNSCKYPNISAEVNNKARGHIHMYAEFTNVTMELLQAVLRGEEELTRTEIFNFSRNMYRPLGYISSPVLSYYDLTNQKHYRKVLCLYYKLNSFVPVSHFEHTICKRILPFEEIMQRGLVTRAYINKLLDDLRTLEELQKARNNQPRGLVYINCMEPVEVSHE